MDEHIVEFLVEASSYERFSLWRNHSHESKKRWSEPAVQWEEIAMGSMAQIQGTYGKTCVELFWKVLNGKKVLFFWPTSNLVEWDKVHEWLETQYPGVKKCDADNFHQCLSFITPSTPQP